ncbi:hypothetical protein [Agaribacter flavus]|uniref:Uncharacterized protein n=1 Tax=Agaribacter flavus TaxID=1902781 RepID=A0ABV7FJJ1_9ALTE
MQELKIYDNVIAYSSKFDTVITLLVDEHTNVAVADRPIFGCKVTIDDKLYEHVGGMLAAGYVLGWVDYISVNKFACLTEQNHYLEAGQFFLIEGNALKLAHPSMLINIYSDMTTDKKILKLRVHLP